MFKPNQITPEASKIFLAAVEPEFYSVLLTPKEIQCLRRYPATAEKIACNVTPVITTENWEIKLEKKFGFINTETIFEEGKQKSNLEVQQLFSILAVDLMENLGYTEEQVRNTVIGQDKENVLSVYQKQVLKKLLEKATLSQNNVLEDITFFLSKRLHPLWNEEDTSVLPKELLEQFKYFIDQEKSGWVNENEEIIEGGLGESSEVNLKATLTGTDEK